MWVGKCNLREGERVYEYDNNYNDSHNVRNDCIYTRMIKGERVYEYDSNYNDSHNMRNDCIFRKKRRKLEDSLSKYKQYSLEDYLKKLGVIEDNDVSKDKEEKKEKESSTKHIT